MNYVELTIFTILTIEVLLAALMCVSVKSATNAAVWLITLFIGIAGFYVFLNSEFITPIGLKQIFSGNLLS